MTNIDALFISHADGVFIRWDRVNFTLFRKAIKKSKPRGVSREVGNPISKNKPDINLMGINKHTLPYEYHPCDNIVKGSDNLRSTYFL